MNDLISRSALLEAFGEPPNAVDPLDRVWLQQFGDWLEYTDKVKAAPTIEALPVRHGEWDAKIMKDIGTYTVYWCSECNCYSYFKYNYCPNCGAKMDGDDHD